MILKVLANFSSYLAASFSSQAKLRTVRIEPITSFATLFASENFSFFYKKKYLKNTCNGSLSAFTKTLKKLIKLVSNDFFVHKF